MKRLFFFRRLVGVMAALAALSLSAAPLQAQAPVLQIADVLRLTLANNPQLREAQGRLDRADADAQKAVAPFRLPTLTLTGNYTRLSASNAQSINTGASTIQNPYTVGLTGTAPGSQTVKLASNARTALSGSAALGTPASGTTTTTTTATGIDLSQFGLTTALTQDSVSISLAQRLDITGLGRAYQKDGIADIDIARQQLAQTRQDTLYAASAAFYTALRDQELIRVQEDAVSQSEEQVRIAQVQFDQGAYARSDVLRADTQLANNRQSLISARNQAAISRSALADDIGIDPDTLAPLAADESPDLPAPPALDPPALLARALSQRPEAIQARLDIEKAQANLRIARSGEEPSLTAALGGTYNGTDGLNASQRATGSLTFSLSFPLYDGGVTADNVHAAQADARLAAAQQDEYENGIRAEVAQAILAVQDARDRAANDLPAVDEAREGYRLSQARLQAGDSAPLSLYDAQTALTQAEVNAVNARYDYFSALARLVHATGDPITPSLTP